MIDGTQGDQQEGQLQQVDQTKQQPAVAMPVMKQDLFERWRRQRTYTLPDEEELALMRRVQRSHHRTTVSAIVDKNRERQRQRQQRKLQQQQQGTEEAAPSTPAASASASKVQLVVPQGHAKGASSRRSAGRDGFGVEADEEGSVLDENRTIADLPPKLRLMVFQFVHAIPVAYTEDLNNIMSLLKLEDAGVLRDSKASRGIITTFQEAIKKTHTRNCGEFAVLAMCMGLDIKTSVPTHPLYQRYTADIAWVTKELAVQGSREEQFARWTTFREMLMRQTCASVRSTVRNDMRLWEEIIEGWRSQRVDVMLHIAEKELMFLQRRAKGIEFLGNPELELDDIRNMFWEVNLPLPQGTTDGYTQTLTVSQVITLGIVDLPWVRGYSWEEREIPLDDDEVIAEGGDDEDGPNGGKCLTVSSVGAYVSPHDGTSNDASSLTGTRTNTTAFSKQTDGDRKAVLLSPRHAANEAERELRELDNHRVAEDAAETEQRKKAHEIAADGMTQRLWMSTEQYRHRWLHRFGGCEYCAQLPVHHVGLRKENSGACADIVVCEGCFEDLYSNTESVAHRMYKWYLVRDLIAHEDDDESSYNKDADQQQTGAAVAAAEEGTAMEVFSGKGLIGATSGVVGGDNGRSTSPLMMERTASALQVPTLDLQEVPHA